MSYPKISIVTPNYNGAKYLEETILSVIDQKYPALEYIIIDGGSTDRSVEIIKKYEKYLAYWISEPDKGMYDALQKGFNKSTGDIMAWLNSDDLYNNKTLASVAEIFTKFDSIEWIMGIPTIYDTKGRITNFCPLRKWSKYDYYSGQFKWIQQESVFWKRSLWNKSGGKLGSRLKYAGDFELWLRFFRHVNLYSVSLVLGGARVHSKEQLSSKFLNEYVAEVNNCLLKEQIDLNSKKIVRNYKIIKKVISLLNKLQLFKTSWIDYQFKKKFFDLAPYIVFDRLTNEFSSEN